MICGLRFGSIFACGVTLILAKLCRDSFFVCSVRCFASISEGIWFKFNNIKLIILLPIITQFSYEFRISKLAISQYLQKAYYFIIYYSSQSAKFRLMQIQWNIFCLFRVSQNTRLGNQNHISRLFSLPRVIAACVFFCVRLTLHRVISLLLRSY